MRKWIALIAAVLAVLPGCQTYQSGMTLPSPKYLEHPSQYIPESPPFPLERELATMEARPGKLTVANVLKEEAMLFLVTKDGLTFVRKLPHGEAADLDATAGQRYAAVFASAPYQVGHEVKAAGETWVLRVTPRPAVPAR
jgi:hypothetical protein